MDSTTSSKDVVSTEVIDFIKIFPSLQIVDDDYSKIRKVTINYNLIFLEIIMKKPARAGGASLCPFVCIFDPQLRGGDTLQKQAPVQKRIQNLTRNSGVEIPY